MEGDESKSQLPQEYSHISLKQFVAENVKGFKECVEVILGEIEKDGNFSKMTDELYDQKKSCLTRHLAKLFHIHKVLADQYRTPIGLYSVLNRGSSGFCVSKTENSKSSVSDLKSAIKTMGEELELSKKKVIVSNIVIEELKQQRFILDSKANQFSQQIQLYENILCLATKRNYCNKKIISGSQEKLSLYEAEISKRDDQIKELSKKNKQITSEFAQLKSNHKVKENNWKDSIGKLRKKLEEKGESVLDLNKKLDAVQAEKCSQDTLTQELETRLNSLQDDLARVLASSDTAQKVTNKLEKRVLELERKVDMQKEVISVKDESVFDLNKKLETVRAEKCSQDTKIQEMETRLNSVHADHVRVLTSYDNGQNDTNEIMQRMIELKREVDMQKNVILVGVEENREYIMQLSSSMEHCQSRYQQLHQAFVSRNTIDFLH